MLNSGFITGFLTSAGLIVAIGAQNSFILRQGIRREYIFSISVTCFLCDILCISIGVLGVGKIINDSKIMLVTITAAGTLFLLWYGYHSLSNAWRGHRYLSVQQMKATKQPWKKVIAATLAVSLLNPHLWLDTVVIIGGISSTFSDYHKLYYLAGALTASFIWFFSIGYLAALLSRYFVKSITWRMLDGVIGMYMLFMAYQLFLFILKTL